jgi:uncharacterized membrane protein
MRARSCVPTNWVLFPLSGTLPLSGALATLNCKLECLLAVLAILGLVISTYFTAIAYRWINPEAAYVPGFCRMGEKTCASVVFTPRARVFGIPNSVLGQGYYIFLLACLWTGTLWSEPLVWVVLVSSFLTVLLGIYLTYSLLFITRVNCRLCYTGHVINATLFGILLSGYLRG